MADREKTEAKVPKDKDRKKGSSLAERKRDNSKKKVKDVFIRPNNEELDNEAHQLCKKEEVKEATTPNYEKEKKEDGCSRWANGILAKPIRKISREYIDNKKVKPSEYTTEAYDKHEPKNRYNDIVCIDATRVILKDRSPEDDYIHANWMTMPDGQKYICTQGPIMDTLEDFWHMVFTEKSTVIIMLCNFMEGKHEKCARYYPKSTCKAEDYGPYKVTLKKKESDPFEGIKYNILEVERGGSSMTVHHIANPYWSDHTAPEKPGPTVGMYKMTKKLAAGSPITVHCSAGIGRTSTFVGIDYASQKIRADGEVSMVDLMKDLRGQRFHSIQSPHQYIFMHICILELFADEGLISRKGKYSSYVESYAQVVRKFSARMAEKEKKEKE